MSNLYTLTEKDKDALNHEGHSINIVASGPWADHCHTGGEARRVLLCEEPNRWVVKYQHVDEDGEVGYKVLAFRSKILIDSFRFSLQCFCESNLINFEILPSR